MEITISRKTGFLVKDKNVEMQEAEFAYQSIVKAYLFIDYL